MDYVSLGKSDLLVSRTGYGAMGLKDLSDDIMATHLIKKAYEDGVNFFDTSRSVDESERRLGSAVKDFREDIFIATKTLAHTSDELADDIDQSLTALQTNYIDLYQLEKLNFLPEKGGEDGLVDKLLKLREDGVIRHFGVTTESMAVAQAVLESDVPWETLQFPFNMLCQKDVEDLVLQCAEKNIGFIGMQPLCGGLISNVPLAVGYLLQFENAIPVWGARTEEELHQILYFSDNPPVYDEKFFQEVRKERYRFN